jgi:hypothetical protein
MVMSATRLNPSIDEMARDARALAGTEPRAWARKFRQLLACYGWRVEKEGRVYFVPVRGKIETVLEDWQIERS